MCKELPASCFLFITISNIISWILRADFLLRLLAPPCISTVDIHPTLQPWRDTFCAHPVEQHPIHAAVVENPQPFFTALHRLRMKTDTRCTNSPLKAIWKKGFAFRPISVCLLRTAARILSAIIWSQKCTNVRLSGIVTAVESLMSGNFILWFRF